MNESGIGGSIQQISSKDMSTKHPQFHRFYSCQQQPNIIFHPVGRYHTFQVPSRPDVCNGDKSVFHPTTHVVSSDNKKSSVIQMTLPVKAVKQPTKAFTYSLDRRQIQTGEYQNTKQHSHLYQNLNGNIVLFCFNNCF